MDISVHIGTKVFGGWDSVGNPVTHELDIGVSDESQRGEHEFDATRRVTHLALETLAHTVAHLLSDQSEDIMIAALKQIGADTSDGEGEDEELVEEEFERSLNEIPSHPDQKDSRYGWNDGEDVSDSIHEDDEDEPGHAETGGRTGTLFSDKPYDPLIPF